MFDFWDSELTEEETVSLLQKAVDDIRRRGLVAPAILGLELHKPLAFVGASASVVAAPFLVPFVGFDFVNNYSRLFAKRENVERLIKMLEETPKAAALSTEDSCPTTI